MLCGFVYRQGAVLLHGATAATVRRLEKLGYVHLEDRPVLRCRQIVPAKLDGPLVLNAAQAAAYETLAEKLQSDAPGVALLYGVTGSGKTAVYLQLIARCLSWGRRRCCWCRRLP